MKQRPAAAPTPGSSRERLYMKPKVYFADMRTDHKGNLFDKISRLLDYCAHTRTDRNR